MFYAELNELLTRELAEHGYSGVEVRVTPMRTEIIIRATRTQNVLGALSVQLFMFRCSPLRCDHSSQLEGSCTPVSVLCPCMPITRQASMCASTCQSMSRSAVVQASGPRTRAIKVQDAEKPH